MIKIKDIINSHFGVASGIDSARPGQAAFANITQHAPQSEFLTTFARRYSEESNIAQARRMLAADAPIVSDGSTFEYRYWPLEQGFTTVDYKELKRAVGGDYKMIDDKSETRAGTLEDIGLCIAVEKDHLDRIPNYRETLVKKLTDTIERASFIQTLSVFEDFADERTVSIANDRPDTVIRELLTDAIVRPNTMLFGPKAWDLRLSLYEGKLDVGSLDAPKTPEAFGARYGLDVLVPNGRKSVGAGAFPFIVSDKIYLAFTQGTSTEDMSNMKMFRSDNSFEVYESEHPQGRKVLITVSCRQGLQITSAQDAYVIKLTA